MLCQLWTSQNCGVPCLKASVTCLKASGVTHLKASGVTHLKASVTHLKASGITQSEQAAAVYSLAGDKHNVDGDGDLDTD